METTTKPNGQQGNESGKNLKRNGWIAILLLLFLFAVINVVRDSLVIVYPGERAVKTVFGKLANETYAPGSVWKVPFSTSLGCEVKKVDIKPQRYSYNFDVKTKDWQNISFSCAIVCEMNDTVIHRLYDKYPLGYSEYEQKVVADLVNSVVRGIVGLSDIWLFVGEQQTIISDAMGYIVNDNLIEKGFLSVETFRILGFKASAEFEALIEQTVQAKQGVKLEEYKVEMAKVATKRVEEEAQQAYIRLAKEAEAKGLELKLKSEALKNPIIVKYELAKAAQKWNGNITLPNTLMMMGNDKGTVLPFIPVNPSK